MINAKKFGIKYCSLGASGKVGASAHYLRLGEWGILLDSGLHPSGKSEESLPDFDLLKNEPVNAIIISHAHLDHLGALPVAVRFFPQARVYMTPATAALSEEMLFHYYLIQKRKAGQEAEKFTPLYTVEEIERILYLFQSFQYNFEFYIHGFRESNIKVQFWDAGHILGSAGVEVRWKNRSVFYTGNTRKSPQFILKGARYPSKCDILITETTYGNNEAAPQINKKREVNRFGDFLMERLKKGGSVLIPVFALGRTQEILYLLHLLLKKSQIPVVPIYPTGFGIKINKIYDRQLHKIYPKLRMEKLRSITYDTLRGKRFRKPCIILATSGMMYPHTVSYDIARDFLQERRNAIALVGWADPETPGGSLRQDQPEKIKGVFGVDNYHCRIEIFHFSAHSHRLELLEIVRMLSPQKTLLCHGEKDALLWMYNAINVSGLSGQTFIPRQGKFLEL